MIILILSIIFIISSNKKIVYFGKMIGLSSFTILFFLLGIIQFFPSRHKIMSSAKSAIMKVFGFSWIICSILIATGDLPNYYRDIPNIVNSDYSSYEGNLTDYYIAHGRTTTTYFTIGEKKFKVDGKYNDGVLVKDKRYRVEYLPNTKYVMNLYSYKYINKPIITYPMHSLLDH